MILSPAVLAAQQSQASNPLTFQQAMHRAAEQSARSVAARLQVEQAHGVIVQRRAELFPHLSGFAAETGRTFNTATFGIDFPVSPGSPPLFDPDGQVEGPVRLMDVRARATVPLLDVAAVRRVQEASSLFKASDALADEAAELAALNAAELYVQTLMNAELVNARLADSVLADSLVQIARAQVEAGIGVSLDITRAEAQLAGLKADLISSRNARARSALALRRALGLALDAPLELTDSLALPGGLDTTSGDAQLFARALLRRPDVRAAYGELEAAERSVSAERATRLPTMEAFGDYGAIGKGTSHLLGTYNWGVQVQVPIFTGFAARGRIEEANARARALDVRRQDIEAGVALEIRAAQLDLAATAEQLQATRDRRRLAEREVAEARERFENGLSGNADVITAQLGLNTARTAEVSVLSSYRIAAVALARAEGILLENP